MRNQLHLGGAVLTLSLVDLTGKEVDGSYAIYNDTFKKILYTIFRARKSFSIIYNSCKLFSTKSMCFVIKKISNLS